MKHRLAAVLFACVLVANTAYGQKVTTTVNPTAPFDSYRTYAWIQGTPAPHPLAEQRVRALIVMELASKGLNPVDELSDLYVATHVITQDHSELLDNGFGSGLGGAVQQYAAGTLIVELYDAYTRQLVWRAVASNTVSAKPRKNTEHLNKALEEIFEKYPTGPR